MTEYTKETKKDATEASRAEKEAFLRQYGRMKERVHVLHDRLRRQAHKKYGVSAMVYDRPPSATTNVKKDIPPAVITAIDQSIEIEDEITQLTQKMSALNRILRMRVNDTRLLNALELRYIDCLLRKECACALGLSHENSFDKLHARAIDAFHLTRADIEEVQRIKKPTRGNVTAGG